MDRNARDSRKHFVQGGGKGLVESADQDVVPTVPNAPDVRPSQHEHEPAHHTSKDNKKSVFSTKSKGKGLDTGRSITLARLGG